MRFLYLPMWVVLKEQLISQYQHLKNPRGAPSPPGGGRRPYRSVTHADQSCCSRINASGDPDFFYTTVPDVTQEQIDDGEHYEFAVQAAEDLGYEPVRAFDANDSAAAKLSEMASYFAN